MQKNQTRNNCSGRVETENTQIAYLNDNAFSTHFWEVTSRGT